MAKKQHTHKLRRHIYESGYTVYFCVLDCNYKIDAKQALGKKCICHRCDKEFVMNERSIRLAKPHCDDCTKGEKHIPKVEKLNNRVAVIGERRHSRIESTDVATDLRQRLLSTLSEDKNIHLPASNADVEKDLL